MIIAILITQLITIILLVTLILLVVGGFEKIGGFFSILTTQLKNGFSIILRKKMKLKEVEEEDLDLDGVAWGSVIEASQLGEDSVEEKEFLVEQKMKAKAGRRI